MIYWLTACFGLKLGKYPSVFLWYLNICGIYSCSKRKGGAPFHYIGDSLLEA